MANDICWSCEKPKTTIPVMFPASPAPDAPLMRHWWCEDCTQHWLGEDAGSVTVLESTGVVESLQIRGFREVADG